MRRENATDDRKNDRILLLGPLRLRLFGLEAAHENRGGERAQAAAQAVVLPQPLLTEQTLRQLRPKTVGQGKIIPHAE